MGLLIDLVEKLFSLLIFAIGSFLFYSILTVYQFTYCYDEDTQIKNKKYNDWIEIREDNKLYNSDETVSEYLMKAWNIPKEIADAVGIFQFIT